MATTEEHEGKTPNGGVRAVAYYSDDSGKPVEKEQSTKMEIVEYDAEDKVVGRTYMRKRSSRKSTPAS